MTVKSVTNKATLFKDMTAWLPEIFRENSLLLITDVAQPDTESDWTQGSQKLAFDDQPCNMRPFSESQSHPQSLPVT